MLSLRVPAKSNDRPRRSSGLAVSDFIESANEKFIDRVVSGSPFAAYRERVTNWRIVLPHFLGIAKKYFSSIRILATP